jgi:glycosyltransferase involved in cell wall biosynthesis
MSTTVVIKTVGRHTLKDAILSAEREGFKEILVVSDGPLSLVGKKDVESTSASCIELGKKWGFYGGMAGNVAAAMVSSDFITFLDDDDEFAEGAGEIIRSRLKEDTDVDIWISGVRFNQPIRVIYPKKEGEPETVTSTDLCLRKDLGVLPGNVAMPTYRTSVFSKIPFTDYLPPEQGEYSDFNHVAICAQVNYKIDWFEEVLYLVRPSLKGTNGAGQ